MSEPINPTNPESPYIEPISASDSEEQGTRRSFLASGVAAGVCYAAAMSYPIYRYLASPAEMASEAAAVTEVTLKDAQKLAAGAAMMFKFGSAPAILIHHSDDRWIAMTAVCTHLGCTVQYEADQNRIHCACHGGVYDPYSGANVSGPPPKPLKTYKVTVGAADVTVSRA